MRLNQSHLQFTLFPLPSQAGIQACSPPKPVFSSAYSKTSSVVFYHQFSFNGLLFTGSCRFLHWLVWQESVKYCGAPAVSCFRSAQALRTLSEVSALQADVE